MGKFNVSWLWFSVHVISIQICVVLGKIVAPEVSEQLRLLPVFLLLLSSPLPLSSLCQEDRLAGQDSLVAFLVPPALWTVKINGFKFPSSPTTQDVVGSVSVTRDLVRNLEAGPL